MQTKHIYIYIYTTSRQKKCALDNGAAAAAICGCPALLQRFGLAMSLPSASTSASTSNSLHVSSLSTSHLAESNGVVCTICCEVPDEWSRCAVPTCAHVFCTDCILSWATVKPLCPNCKEPFQSLLVRRDPHSGDYCEHERLVDVADLQICNWVNLQKLEPVVEDIASAFNYVRVSPEELRREAERSSLATGVPTYSCEELEDEAEELFWAHELSSYNAYDEDTFVRPTRQTKFVGNRRHGVNGYMSSGHMLARANANGASSSTGAGPSSSSSTNYRSHKTGTGIAEHEKIDVSDASAPSIQSHRRHKPPSSGGKRKKKVKKKSRAAGIAAAEAAAVSPSLDFPCVQVSSEDSDRNLVDHVARNVCDSSSPSQTSSADAYVSDDGCSMPVVILPSCKDSVPS